MSDVDRVIPIHTCIIHIITKRGIFLSYECCLECLFSQYLLNSREPMNVKCLVFIFRFTQTHPFFFVLSHNECLMFGCLIIFSFHPIYDLINFCTFKL